MSLDQPKTEPTASVTVTGPGAVGIGGNNHGPITTTIHNTYLPGPGSARQNWLPMTVGVLLGGTVGGDAVAILSGDYRWRLVIVATATGLVLAVPIWLRRYPPRSALTRWATAALLIGATVGIVFAGFGPPPTVPWAIGGAALFTTGAVLIPTHPEARLRLLSGAALIALGVVAAGIGAAALAHHDRLFGAVGIASGVAIAGIGAAALAHHDRLSGAAFIAGGVALAGIGAADLAHHDLLSGAAGIAAGVALAGAGAADLAHHDLLLGAAGIAGGVAAVWYGTLRLLDNGIRQWLRQRWAALITDPTTIEDSPRPNIQRTDHRP